MSSIRTPDQRLRVFVSSTLKELRPEREAAKEAINGLRLTPIMFDVGARPHPPRDLYRSYIEQSHVFIGIYAKEYGWVAPGMDISGLEDEYRLASGKARLIYIKHVPERDPAMADFVAGIASDADIAYKRFSTPVELKHLIENDLALLLSERFEARTPEPAAAPASTMEAPHIQYAQTTDGVNIAFWTMGQGPPLVVLPSLFWGTILGPTGLAARRRWHQLLSRKRRLIRPDFRGWGYSDRDFADASLEAHLLDIDAVLDRLSLDRVDLVGAMWAGPPAIAYAATRPARVSTLVLIGTCPRGAELFAARGDALLSLADSDWELYTETIAHDVYGWSDIEAREFASAMRQTTSMDEARPVIASIREFDASEALASVQCPTLILHGRRSRVPDFRTAQQMAARLPNARLVVFETATMVITQQPEAAAQAIEDFLEKAGLKENP